MGSIDIGKSPVKGDLATLWQMSQVVTEQFVLFCFGGGGDGRMKKKKRDFCYE